MNPLVHNTAFQLSTPLGYTLHGTIYTPIVHSNHTIVLCPPPREDRHFFLKDRLIHWEKWLGLGSRVLLFDPLGCGESWGIVGWGSREDRESIKLILSWLERNHGQDISLVCFGAGILSLIDSSTNYPIVAVDPLYTEEQLKERYPDLSKKDASFWKERLPTIDQLQNIHQLSTENNRWRGRLRRKYTLLQCGLGLL